MGVNALFLVVTKYHALNFVLLISGNCLRILKVLLKSEFLDTVAVNLELLVTELFVGFVARNNRVEVEYAFVWSLQVPQNVVEVRWFV